jgi:hypothetical protein
MTCSQTGEKYIILHTVADPCFFCNKLNFSGLVMSLCVPVVLHSTLRGVTCVDVTVDTLFSEIQYFQQTSSTYAFLIDGYGQLLVHPLLPQPQTFSMEAPLADLTDIEYDYNNDVSSVLMGMLSYVFNAHYQVCIETQK